MRLPVPPPRLYFYNGADDETRTRDPNLGKVVLYQLSYVRNGAGEGSRTPTPKALDPKSSASASSATPAFYYFNNGEPYWTRTSDTLIKSQVLYQLS